MGYIAVLTDASLLPCSEHSFYSDASEFARRVQPYAFMRIGRYSLVLGRATVAVARTYSDEDTALMLARRGQYAVSPQYRASLCSDRRSQLRAARIAFRTFAPQHPMRALVEHDARLEERELT